MSSAKNEAEKLVARVRRVWGNESIELGSGSKGWLYRITSPSGARIQLHSSPSDVNWLRVVMRDLNSAGFTEDENNFIQEEQIRKAEKAESERLKNLQQLEEAQIRANALARAAGPLGSKVADVGWIFSKHDLPETRRVLITPELSQRILDELNSHNRPLREGRIEYWSKIMKSGKWKYTHQGIAFDTAGTLQDGQHRLSACAREKFTIDINTSVGMPVENFSDIDTGAGRTGGDTIAIDNPEFPFPSTLAAAGKLIYVYDKFGSEMRLGIRQRVSNDDLRIATKKFGKDLEESVVQARNISVRRGGPRMSPNALGAGIYLISRDLPLGDERIKEFVRGYSQGTNLQDGDARIALRSFMSNLEGNRKVSVEDQLGVWLKSWNSWVNKKAVAFISFRKDEMMPKVYIPKMDD